MPISLNNLRSQIVPGLIFASKENDALVIPEKFDLLRRVAAVLGFKTVGELFATLDRFEVDGVVYESVNTLVGREWPQGWGRGPGGAEASRAWEDAERAAGRDGKADIFQMIDNAPMVEFRKQKSAFFDELTRGF